MGVGSFDVGRSALDVTGGVSDEKGVRSVFLAGNGPVGTSAMARQKSGPDPFSAGVILIDAAGGKRLQEKVNFVQFTLVYIGQ